MSQKILIVVLTFNLLMASANVIEKKYLWAVYWLGAFLINSAVFFMKK